MSIEFSFTETGLTVPRDSMRALNHLNDLAGVIVDPVESPDVIKGQESSWFHAEIDAIFSIDRGHSTKVPKSVDTKVAGNGTQVTYGLEGVQSIFKAARHVMEYEGELGSLPTTKSEESDRKAIERGEEQDPISREQTRKNAEEIVDQLGKFVKLD